MHPQPSSKLILWLDADPNRAARFYARLPENSRNNVIWTRTAEEAIIVLRDYCAVLAEVHMEHDLQGPMPLDTRSEFSGMEVIRYLEKSPSIRCELKDAKFVTHTYNAYAARQIVKRLGRLGFEVKHIPFGL